jgi:hypothetical protein
MGLTKEYADQLNIANCHRIPRNPQAYRVRDEAPDPDSPEVPNAIIVKLVNMIDRGRILAATRNIKRETRVTVRTDLPKEWKVRRGQLASVAYKMRKDDGLQTAIRETAQGVWLTFRKKKEDPWQRYTD